MINLDYEEDYNSNIYFIFVIGAVSAQSVYDGVKIADKDLNGTAGL